MNINLKTNDNTQNPKALTNMELYELGISVTNFGKVNTLDELRQNPANIVIGECKKQVSFVQNHFKPQQLKKKQLYVMNAGVYGHLHYDSRTKTEILKPAPIQFKKVYKPYFGQDLNHKSLLVFRQGGIGDLLFIQPNLIYLKEKYPTCTIKFACGPQYQDMVKEWDCIDELIDLPFTIDEIFRSNYQIVFEGVIERCKESEDTCSYNLFTKWMGLNLPDELLIPKQEANEDITKNNLKILEEMNIKPKDFIILQMRASSPIRTPSPNVWKKIIETLVENGHNILLTDALYKSTEVDKFIDLLKLSNENKNKVQNYAIHSKTIAETISITSLAKLAIGTDSSLIHIAESLGVKSFALMGPFPGRLRLSTYKNNDWIDVNSLSNCTPCFIHSQKPCNNSLDGFPLCYSTLDYKIFYEKIERLLNR